jgi:hypothetical protein
MSIDEVNNLFCDVFKVQNKTELFDFTSKIKKLVETGKIETEDSFKIFLAIRTKENELAISSILDLINTMIMSSTEEVAMLDLPQDKDKLH